MHRYRQKMTAPLREAIVRYKTSILTSEHRTPMHSGYWIYQAFLDEGITDPNEVSRFLVAHGIRMERAPETSAGARIV
jgi:hypothetical protein